MRCAKKETIWIIGVVFIEASGFDQCMKTLVAAAAMKYL